MGMVLDIDELSWESKRRVGGKFVVFVRDFEYIFLLYRGC